MRNILYLKFTDEDIVNESGLAFVGKLLDDTSLRKNINNPINVFNSSILPNYDIIASYLGLLCQSKTQFASIEEYRHNDFFFHSLRLDKKIPSESILRQRLDLLGLSEYIKYTCFCLQSANIQILKHPKVSLTCRYKNFVPVDIDVSVHDNSDTKKEGVEYTYKECFGFAPIYAYIGEEGYLLFQELRPGSEHSQSKGTIPFLKKTVDAAKSLIPKDKALLFTLDSGHCCEENYLFFMENNVDFIIKKNNRVEDLEKIFNDAKASYEKNIDKCIKIDSREGKEYYIRNTYKIINDKNTGKEISVRVVQECIKRTIDKHGQILLVPEYEIKQYATSLDYTIDCEKVIELYHKHATCEQFHSELKTDMDLERFPSGKFNTNQIVLWIATIAFNILRLIGQSSIKVCCDGSSVKRKRISTVIKDMMYLACRFVKHARKLFISIPKKEHFKNMFKYLYYYLNLST